MQEKNVVSLSYPSFNERKHPSDDPRLDALRSYAVLDTPPEDAFDRITDLAARLFDVPVGAIGLIDPLTNLLNHRAFHKRLKEDIEAAPRPDRRRVVLVVDLENFKFFNDAYGHLAGDDVLRRASRTFEAVCGPGAVLTRRGQGTSRRVTRQPFRSCCRLESRVFRTTA